MALDDAGDGATGEAAAVAGGDEHSRLDAATPGAQDAVACDQPGVQGFPGRLAQEGQPLLAVLAQHSHRARVSVYLKDAEVKLTPRGGETTTATLVAGTAAWGEPTTHVGLPQSDIENLSIELQELGGDVIERSDIDATLVDPEHHVIEFENDWVRVVRMTYPAGETSSVHDHPPGFAVFLTDADMQNIPEEGEPVELKFEAGDAIWGDAGTAHATANPGDEDVVLIRVEMKKKPS